MKVYVKSGELQDVVSGSSVEACIEKAMKRAPGGIQLGRYFEWSEQGFDSITGEYDVRELLIRFQMMDE